MYTSPFRFSLISILFALFYGAWQRRRQLHSCALIGRRGHTHTSQQLLFSFAHAWCVCKLREYSSMHYTRHDTSTEKHQVYLNLLAKALLQPICGTATTMDMLKFVIVYTPARFVYCGIHDNLHIYSHNVKEIQCTAYCYVHTYRPLVRCSTTNKRAHEISLKSIWSAQLLAKGNEGKIII